MKTCDVCKNEYDKTFEVIIQGKHHTFDSFECAIHAIAPRCHQCQCAIIGHGAEKDGVMYCSAHCARKEGKAGLCDRSIAITV